MAGDNIWGVTVFVTPLGYPVPFEYGLVDATPPYYGGWLWEGPNGSFVVSPGATEITAQGMTLQEFGTTDLQLVLDTNNLDGSGWWYTSPVEVKGSAWAWAQMPMVDGGTRGDAVAGDGRYTFTLSGYLGDLPHTGLLRSGQRPEFVFVLGYVEYKVWGAAATAGVSAGVRPAGAATFTPVPIEVQTSGYLNTFVTIP